MSRMVQDKETTAEALHRIVSVLGETSTRRRTIRPMASVDRGIDLTSWSDDMRDLAAASSRPVPAARC